MFSALLQRALRLNSQDVSLWVEYTRLELLYLDKMKERQRVLGLDPKKDAAAAPTSVSSTAPATTPAPAAVDLPELDDESGLTDTPALAKVTKPPDPWNDRSVGPAAERRPRGWTPRPSQLKHVCRMADLGYNDRKSLMGFSRSDRSVARNGSGRPADKPLWRARVWRRKRWWRRRAAGARRGCWGC